MRRILFLTVSTLTALAPALVRAQMVAPEEARARRECVEQAHREGWQVREVSGFHSRGGRGYDVHLLVDRPGAPPTTVTCGWDGGRATLSSGYERPSAGPGRDGAPGRTWPGEDSRGNWERGASPAVDACQRALGDRLREEGRRRGDDSAEVYVEQQDSGDADRDAGRDQQVIRGTASYRLGAGPYGMMRFECRIDPRSRRVLEVRYELERPPAGAGPVLGGEREGGEAEERDRDDVRDRPRTLTCESSGNREHTCHAAIAGDVRVSRRLGGAPCVEGRDWWWQDDGITVTNGCRAEFSYQEPVEGDRR